MDEWLCMLWCPWLQAMIWCLGNWLTGLLAWSKWGFVALLTRSLRSNSDSNLSTKHSLVPSDQLSHNPLFCLPGLSAHKGTFTVTKSRRPNRQQVSYQVGGGDETRGPWFCILWQHLKCIIHVHLQSTSPAATPQLFTLLLHALEKPLRCI